MPTQTFRNLNAVSQTLLIPLYFRALESQPPDALVRDPKAVELVGQLDSDFSGVQRLKVVPPIHRQDGAYRALPAWGWGIGVGGWE